MASRRLAVAAAIVSALCLATAGRAQSGIPFGSVMVWPAGWNLLSFAGDTSFGGDVSVIGTLYTLPPGAASYTVTDLAHVKVGTGYWAYFPRRALWLLRTGSRQSFSVTVPRGSCTMVGNPGAVMEPLDAQGNAPQNATTYYAIENACGSCPEYGDEGPSSSTCDSAAVEGQTFMAPAGRYLLHMQSDGRNVPDLQTVIDLQANTSYHLCYFVSATRSQQGLP
jgi:hypothetical protein